MTDKEREEFAISQGLFCVYQRHYRPTEGRYSNALSFCKGFKTHDEARRFVNTNPQKYFMQC